MSEQAFLSQFGDTLYSASTKTSVPTGEALSGKIVGLYFSAHWCPPCRRFTPMLVSFYNKMKAENKDFEIVFCSLDKSEEQFEEYASTMPWKAVPFQGTESTRQGLASKYGARGIPHLVLVGDDESRKVITDDGTTEVMQDPEGTNFPWKPKTFGEVWPAKILTKAGLVDSSTIASKHLMLYFSAHWCPPCKMFTPKLSKAYETLMKERGDDLEVVFVSSDRDEASFNEYHGEMTFCALPFEERGAKEALSKLFGVRGIPTLIMLGPADPTTGDRELINPSLRGVIESGDFSDFPFHPKNYQDLATGADGINDTKSLVVLCENEDDEEQEAIIEAVKKAAEQHKDHKFFWSTQLEGIGQQIRKLLKLENKLDTVSVVLLDLPGYYICEDTDEVTVESILKFIENPGDRQHMA